MAENVCHTLSSCGADSDTAKQLKLGSQFRNWIHSICIVTFDLELGQAMEVIFPADAILTEEDKSNICYLAFPDSNSSCMGDTRFHIRIRRAPGGPPLLPHHIVYNQTCPIFLEADIRYYYGFVCFRQVKDASLPRCYFQKSVVIVSSLPFVNLFMEVCNIISPEIFDRGLNGLEAAYSDINQWPCPVPGKSVCLPLLGSLLQAHIPRDSLRTGTTGAVANTQPLSLRQRTVATNLSVHEMNFFDCFSGFIYHVHLLWELVLTAEPIVVMASSPATTSQMVQGLASMIVPLMYYADYRPYFTIHDSEFKEYTTRIHAPPPIILGVTNPFFAKTLHHWPHIIKVAESTKVPLQKDKLKKGSSLKMLDSKPGVYTYYHTFLQKDKTIVKDLIKGIQSKRPSEAQSARLRRHLLELTESFMIPLERYMATLMPLQKNISPYKAAPNPCPFNPDDFVASLETCGPQLTSGIKGDWVGLYKRFFRSPNFSGWYNIRYKGMKQKLQTLHIEALCGADMKVWVQGKQEVELVDMFLKIKSKLEESEIEQLQLSESVKNQLRLRMDDVMRTLPEDLRAVLKSS